MKNDDDIRLRHRLDAATEALRFTSGRQREDLEADRQLTWALIKAIEIIAEAAGQLSEETKTELSNIPWRDISGILELGCEPAHTPVLGWVVQRLA
jgi:uncharacterized protein with HEPN domain